MKINKLLADFILFIGNLLGFAVMYSTLFLRDTISLDSYLIFTFLTTLFYTKSQIDKIELENKIYELKELLKDKL